MTHCDPPRLVETPAPWRVGIVRMCDCGGPTLDIWTDGARRWASCPRCGKTWDMNTMREIQNVDGR